MEVPINNLTSRRIGDICSSSGTKNISQFVDRYLKQEGKNRTDACHSRAVEDEIIFRNYQNRLEDPEFKKMCEKHGELAKKIGVDEVRKFMQIGLNTNQIRLLARILATRNINVRGTESICQYLRDIT